MKKNGQIIEEKKLFVAADYIAALAFIFVALIITVILSSRYFYYQNIVQNGVSQRLIKAKKTIEVVDTQKTDVIKRDIANKIRPVLMPVDENYVKTCLSSLKEEVDKIKNSNSQISKEEQFGDFLEIADVNKKSATVRALTSSSKSGIDLLFENASTLLDTYFKEGITESDIEYYSSEANIMSILGQHTNQAQAKALSGVIEHVLAPNLVIDEYATEVARKNAKAMIKPYTYTFKKGDVIIKPGEPMNQVKKDALKKSGYNPLELNKSGVVGIFLLTCLCMACFIFYVKKFERQYLTYSYMSIAASLAIILVYLSMVISSSVFSNYMMPFAAMTIIMAVFTTPALALVSTILLLGLLCATLFLEPFFFASFVVATVSGVYYVSNICYTKRFDLIKCGLQIGAVLFTAAVIVSMLENRPDFSQAFVAFLFNGIISGVIALGVIPLIENVFKIVTPYGLIELADHNQALLSNLQYKAPGTYHHSLMVANLCEAAAEAIGANPILARVGAFYHDVGKLKRPLFFIENQSYFGIENPHTKLNPRLSKMVITSHTKDGVEIAREHGLPQVIINFIQQHHGEALAGHFYSQAVALEGKENVQEEQFRYPGPKPSSKEIAILMLADAVESAVRSLKNPGQEEIENMINRIITERLNDGQLSDSPLTLKDIKLIAITFNRILRGMQHDRIKYQQLNDFEDRNKIKLGPSKEEKLEKRIQKKQMQKSGEEGLITPAQENRPQEDDTKNDKEN